MRLEKEFTVAMPLDRAWQQLRDLDGLASCLPVAQLHAPDGERVYTGEMTIGANGSAVRCHATARPLDTDDDDHAASLQIRGREVGGPALGSALIESRLSPEDDSTRVALSAEMKVTGHRAAHNAVEDGARAVLEEFAQALERRMREAPAAAPEPPRAPAPRPVAAPPGVPEPLRRYGVPAAVLVLVALLLAALRGPRKGVTVTFRYRP